MAGLLTFRPNFFLPAPFPQFFFSQLKYRGGEWDPNPQFSEAIIEELRTIAEENVFFCDDESMLDARRMDHLADLILQAGLRKKYFLYGRVDTIVKHPELFAKWRDAGLAQVFVGLESFSDRRLNGMRKGTTVEQELQAAKILRDLGILLSR